MAKLTAWLITLIGVVLVLAALKVINLGDAWATWVIALAVLIVGIGKLMRNYSKKKK
jgi:hypothetical protein